MKNLKTLKFSFLYLNQILKLFQSFNIFFIRKSLTNSFWFICNPQHLVNIRTVTFHELYGHFGSFETAYAMRKYVYFPSFIKLSVLSFRDVMYVRSVNRGLLASLAKWFTWSPQSPTRKFSLIFTVPSPPSNVGILIFQYFCFSSYGWGLEYILGSPCLS